MKSIRHNYLQKIIKSEKISLYFLKRFFFILALLLLIQVSSYSQTDTIKNRTNDNRRSENIETGNQTKKTKSSTKRDTTILETEKRLYLFIETPGGLLIDRIDLRTGNKKRILDLGNEDQVLFKRDSTRFRGHWSGIIFGINGFANPESILKTPGREVYFDLDMDRSWVVNFNFAQFSIPLIKNNLGLVTGLGLEVNNYFFKYKNNIQLNQTTGYIEEWDTKAEFNKIKKSKFITTSLTLPLMIEFQARGAGKRLFYIAGGVIGGWNIQATRKVKYRVNGQYEKLIKRGSDLNINVLRAGTIFQTGYRDKKGSSSGIYAKYYFTPLFENNKGPELYPFEVGFRIDF